MEVRLEMEEKGGVEEIAEKSSKEDNRQSLEERWEAEKDKMKRQKEAKDEFEWTKLKTFWKRIHEGREELEKGADEKKVTVKDSIKTSEERRQVPELDQMEMECENVHELNSSNAEESMEKEEKNFEMSINTESMVLGDTDELRAEPPAKKRQRRTPTPADKEGWKTKRAELQKQLRSLEPKSVVTPERANELFSEIMKKESFDKAETLFNLLESELDNFKAARGERESAEESRKELVKAKQELAGIRERVAELLSEREELKEQVSDLLERENAGAKKLAMDMEAVKLSLSRMPENIHAKLDEMRKELALVAERLAKDGILTRGAVQSCEGRIHKKITEMKMAEFGGKKAVAEVEMEAIEAPNPIRAVSLPQATPTKVKNVGRKPRFCVFCACEGTHSTRFCAVFYTNAQRRARLAELDRCVICTGRDHAALICRKQYDQCLACDTPGHSEELCPTRESL